MRSNFDKSLTLLLKHEGGYSNNPRDGGGATNRGVTQTVYDDWRVTHDLSVQTVKNITMAEIMAIYKSGYWDQVRGDKLPSGLDYCLFDFAVNSGALRANRYLQQAVGVHVDGIPGPFTLKAADEADTRELIDRICDDRLAYLRRLSNFDAFGRGWTRRVMEVREAAKAMVV